MEAHRELGVVVGDGRARTPAAAVTEQRQVCAGLEAELGRGERECAEFDEVISAAAGAQL